MSRQRFDAIEYTMSSFIRGDTPEQELIPEQNDAQATHLKLRHDRHDSKLRLLSGMKGLW